MFNLILFFLFIFKENDPDILSYYDYYKNKWYLRSNSYFNPKKFKAKVFNDYFFRLFIKNNKIFYKKYD